MEKDVVCGMFVDKKIVTAQSDYKTEKYYFCSLVCKEKFDKNPEKYIEKRKRS